MEDENEYILREPAVVYGRNKFTEEEYLDIERTAIERHEFYAGEMFHMHGHGDYLAMSGAAHDHNEIFSNLFGELSTKLKGSGCKPYGPDMRLHIPKNTLYTYPDISVYCKGTQKTKDNDTAVNPTVIIEILSPSTRHYDMNAKFSLYKDIPTLKEYILVDSQALVVYVHRLTNGKWQAETYNHSEAIVSIQSLGIGVLLEDIYNGTRFID